MLNKWLLSSFNTFQDAVKLNRTPHSVIISGNTNLGTASLALSMARLFLCADRSFNDGCRSCKSCQYFSSVLDEKTVNLNEDEDSGFDSHPDVVALLPTGATQREDFGLTHSFYELLSSESSDKSSTSSIKVDGVRKLNEWIVQGSVFGRGKVAIISNAHTMMESASNALLKTFEEPPENTLIILLTDSLENLPATILSRASKIQIPRVKSEDAIEYLKANVTEEYSENEILLSLVLSDNSPTGAKECLQSGLVKNALEIVSKINAAVSYHKAGANPELSLSAREEAIALMLNLTDDDKYLVLREYVSELLKYKAGLNVENLPFLNHRNISKLCKISAVTLFDVYNSLMVLRSDVSKIQHKAQSAVLRTVIDTLKA